MIQYLYIDGLHLPDLIEAPDSITDGARGIIGKRGDTAMRERFFSFQ